MFTGIVEDVGTIEHADRSPAGVELRVSCPWVSLADGESVAVDGVCLTVREHGARWFASGVVGSTLGRTTIGSWTVGRRVNLERALRVGDRFGGHIVQGHVDGVGTVTSLNRSGDRWLVDIAVGNELAELMVQQGALTVDGVSLTVNALPSPTTVQISLVEYTLQHTTLGERRPGDRVNVEGDVIGKYVQRLLAAHLQQEMR